jgi:hypothetical protein
MSTGVQRRWRGFWKIRDDVVPLGGHFRFIKEDFGWATHNVNPLMKEVGSDTRLP